MIPCKRDRLPTPVFLGFPGSSAGGKESACNAGDLDSIPGLERSAGEGNSYPLQYSCLENSMDRGAAWSCWRPWVWEGLPENEAHIKVELRDEGKRINPHDIIRTLEYIFTWSHLSLNFSVKWTTELPFLSTLLKSSFYHLHLREIRIIQRKVQKQASIISTNINGF